MIYTGICIGGPMDGERTSRDMPVFRIVNETLWTQPLPFDKDPSGKPDEVLETTTYELSPVYVDATTGKEILAWIPRGQTKRDTLAKLIEGYRPGETAR